MSNLVLIALVEEPAGEHHEEPTAFGFNPGGWVALAMIFVLAIMGWKKVHKAIGAALDDKIAGIRRQLAEAEDLRKDAEALRAEYEAKAKSLDTERKSMLARAKKEADEIVAKAEKDAEALIERRGKMAEEKIAAEQRAAVDRLRASAADAATKAAAKLIGARHDDATDSKLVDDAIAEIAKR
jgi:F-type H+-transporting ATPase subunit b